jgi:hypothetical protein
VLSHYGVGPDTAALLLIAAGDRRPRLVADRAHWWFSRLE